MSNTRIVTRDLAAAGVLFIGSQVSPATLPKPLSPILEATLFQRMTAAAGKPSIAGDHVILITSKPPFVCDALLCSGTI